MSTLRTTDILTYTIGDICIMKQKTVQEEKAVGETIQSRSKTLVENDNPKSGKQRRSKAQIDAIKKQAFSEYFLKTQNAL